MMSQEVLCVVTGPPTPGGPPHRLLPHYLALRPTFHELQSCVSKSGRRTGPTIRKWLQT